MNLFSWLNANRAIVRKHVFEMHVYVIPHVFSHVVTKHSFWSAVLNTSNTKDKYFLNSIFIAHRYPKNFFASPSKVVQLCYGKGVNKAQLYNDL